MLFITIIPPIVGYCIEPGSDLKENNLDPDRDFMNALVLKHHRVGNTNTCFAIRVVVLYNFSTETHREVYWFKWFTFRDSAYMGRWYEIGLGLLAYYFGPVEEFKILS